MIRLLSLCIIMAGMYVSVIWLHDTDGSVAIEWLGYRVEASTSALLAALIALMFSTLILHGIYTWIRQGPKRLRRRIAEKKRDTGYQLLMDGFTAVAAADAHSAKKLARKARKNLGDVPLTLLLSAQTAQLEGDDMAAREHYQAMLSQKDSEFLGLRGLLSQYRNQESPTPDALHKALSLAERANKVRPGTPWVLTSLIEYHCRLNHWDDARGAVKQALRHKVLRKDEYRHKRALVSHLEALHHAGKQNIAKALDCAADAVKREPGFAPARHLLATLYQQDGNHVRAKKIIEKGWRIAPHPLLGELYGSLLAGDAPVKQMKQFDKLTDRNPLHYESHLALAGASMRANQLSRARFHLEHALRIRETIGACTLMAELEQAESRTAGLGRREALAHESAAAEWLKRASDALPDTGWHCSYCHTSLRKWAPTCPQCGHFDTLAWQNQPIAANAGPEAMLALD